MRKVIWAISLMVLMAVGVGGVAQKAKIGQKLNSQEIEEGYISVTGGKVWYRIVGIKQPGIPVIAVHGGPGCPSDYLEPIEGLADERPVIFYDQIGCGRSDLTNDPTLWTLERYVQELDQVRKALKLNKVHLLGQSWGSMLVTEYYLTHRQSGVASLISSGPFHSAPRWEADQQIHIANLPSELQRMIRRNEADGTTASAEYQFAMQVYYNRHFYRSDPWPNNIKRSLATLGAPYFYMWGPSEFYCTGTLKGYDQTPRFKEIAVPMLFTCGKYDECRPETAQWYQSLVPGAEVKIFENAAHQHHVEAAEQYLAVVRDFLKRADRLRISDVPEVSNVI